MSFTRWIIFVIAGLSLALVLQAGLIAYMGYVIVGVLVLSRYLAKSWITHLEAERKAPTGLREIGDSVEVKLKLRNTGAIPIGWLLIEDMLPEWALLQKPQRIKIVGRRINVLWIPTRGTRTLKYSITFLNRGYYQLGPAFAETGDVFGFFRRHRLLSQPSFILVLPKIVSMSQYQFASQRPIGEVRLANRLFEDPTRTAGVRPYQIGDPLQRVHWRATARTGELHSRVFEPTSLAGASLLLDFHQSCFSQRGEPYRSELAITVTCSLAYAVSLLNQQLGLLSNGRDAVDRIREEALTAEDDTAESLEAETRNEFRNIYSAQEGPSRLRPIQIETRRGLDQFQQIREALARLEQHDGLTLAEMIYSSSARLPKDATVIAILAAVSVDTAVALGQLRRQGFAISVVLISLNDDDSPVAQGRLIAEGVRDIRTIHKEEELLTFGAKPATTGDMYNVAVTLA